MPSAISVAAGEPILGVYPSFDGRRPSSPNPSANLAGVEGEVTAAILRQSVFCTNFSFYAGLFTAAAFFVV